jgi:hypothetical protein
MRHALAAALLCLAGVAAAATPDALTPDGGSYYGPLVGGRMHGRGRIEYSNGARYEGEFANGLYWGKGELRYPEGRVRVYRGDFVRGEFEGTGRAEMENGDVFEGEFRKGNFTGRGVHTRKDGARYEGGFKDWTYEGRGRYDDGQGSVWEGPFVRGSFTGRGRSQTPLGEYQGEFEDWRPHGRGTMTYATPRPDGSRRDIGEWRYGMFDVEGERTRASANVETAIYAQKELLDKAISGLKPREPGRINLYLLAIAGDGGQEVFRREVEFVEKEFAERFGTAGRSLSLVNSRSTVGKRPMATVTSVGLAVQAIAARMDREQDILFLFLTSHGSRDHEFVLRQRAMDLPGLRAQALGTMLKDSGIRWKVAVVSACYSGGFIPPLKDPGTLVITAARADRTSFGCADENDFTYFGRAFFKESLPKAGSFQDAFRKAETLVAEWEQKDARDAASAKPGGRGRDDAQSLPQISSGSAIEAQLARWWAQAAR